MSESSGSQTGKKNVMFVDDEPNVLAGIRNLLRRERREWNLSFVEGGAAAIAKLDEQAVDVVASDMRMPGVDGLALLSHVKQHHPNTVRIVLSGFTERESALRLVPVAHQFLAKPCEVNVLRRVIRSSCELHSLLNSARLARLVGNMSHLPSVPATYQKIFEASTNPSTSIKDLAKIVAEDSAIAVKLLQVLNSAFFGTARPTTDMHRAVMLLGMSTIRDLVLGFDAYGSFELDPAVCGIVLDNESTVARDVGQCARAIMQGLGAGQAEVTNAMIAGLLHDVGRLVLAVNEPQLTLEISKMGPEGEARRLELEHEALGVDSVEVGAYLLSLWGIPYPVVRGVAYHHRPAAAGLDEMHTAIADDTSQGDGLDGEKVTATDRAPLCGEKSRPSLGAFGSWVDACIFEDSGNSRTRDSMAEVVEGSADPGVAPFGVFFGHRNDESADLIGGFGSAGPAANTAIVLFLRLRLLGDHGSEFSRQPRCRAPQTQASPVGHGDSNSMWICRSPRGWVRFASPLKCQGGGSSWRLDVFNLRLGGRCCSMRKSCQFARCEPAKPTAATRG